MTDSDKRMKVVALHVSGHGSQVWIDYISRVKKGIHRAELTLLLNVDDNGGCTGDQRRHLNFLYDINNLDLLIKITSSDLCLSNPKKCFDTVNLPVGDLRSFLTTMLDHDLNSIALKDPKERLRKSDLLECLKSCYPYDKTKGAKESAIKELTESVKLGLQLMLKREYAATVTDSNKIRLYMGSFVNFLDTELGDTFNIKIGNMLLKYLMIYFGGASEKFFECNALIPENVKMRYMFDRPLDLAGEISSSDPTCSLPSQLIIGESVIDQCPVPVTSQHYIMSGSVPDQDINWRFQAVLEPDNSIKSLIQSADIVLSGAGSLSNQEAVLRLVRPYIRKDAKFIKILNLFQTPNEISLTEFTDFLLGLRLTNMHILGPAMDTKTALSQKTDTRETWEKVYCKEDKTPILWSEFQDIARLHPSVVRLRLPIVLQEGGSNPGLKYNTDRLSRLIESIMSEVSEHTRELKQCYRMERSSLYIG